MKTQFTAALIGLAMIGAANAQPIENTHKSAPLLTRETAIVRALQDDPGVAAAALGIRAAEASARQAGLRPNPALDVQLENFGGTGPLSGVDRAEITYALSQKFELGGDRRARQSLADRQTDTARIRADLSALDLREAVEIAFVEAQAAQAFVEVAKSRLDVAKEFSIAVNRRVRAARDPLAARARVAARLAETEIEVETSLARANASKAALASYWGGPADFSVETVSFFIPAPRSIDGSTSPDLALAEAQRDSAEARIEIERAKRIPDPNVRAGFRQLRETDASAFIVGLSVPLPIWNRNSGSLAAARAERTRAGYEIEARARALSREIAFLSSQLDAARAEIDAYTTRVIPSSEDALARSIEGYAQGGLSYIEVLDAQQSLTDAKLRQVSALLTYHRADAKLSRLSGDRASPITVQENLQ